ncbi:hypothetical protein D9M69_591360 [compost metagenome]
MVLASALISRAEIACRPAFPLPAISNKSSSIGNPAWRRAPSRLVQNDSSVASSGDMDNQATCAPSLISACRHWAISVVLPNPAPPVTNSRRLWRQCCSFASSCSRATAWVLMRGGANLVVINWVDGVIGITDAEEKPSIAAGANHSTGGVAGPAPGVNLFPVGRGAGLP